MKELTNWQHNPCLIQIGTDFAFIPIDNLGIFSLFDIVEPFLPIGFQNALQIVSVVRALHEIVIYRKKYNENMKKIFWKIQKGTTRMFRHIKALGVMETKQKCVVNVKR